MLECTCVGHGIVVVIWSTKHKPLLITHPSCTLHFPAAVTPSNVCDRPELVQYMLHHLQWLSSVLVIGRYACFYDVIIQAISILGCQISQHTMNLHLGPMNYVCVLETTCMFWKWKWHACWTPHPAHVAWYSCWGVLFRPGITGSTRRLIWSYDAIIDRVARRNLPGRS